MKVYKFGGASVRNADGVQNLLKIIGDERDLFIIVSAMGKTTNALEKVFEGLQKGDKAFSMEHITALRQYHAEIVNELYGAPTRLEKIERLFGELEQVATETVYRPEDAELWYDTVVAFGELYSALQTGVVDGAEQPIANYKSNAFPEVANNLILDGHTLGAVQAVITDNAWGKLTANQQAAVMAAAADTQKFNADLSETAENKVLEELRSSGCNVVDVDDKTPWQEACAKVIKDNTSDQAELYQKLLDMKA